MTDPSTLRKALQHYFGFPDFRDGQIEVVQSILAGKDAMVVMPTGSGKSLCYQFTSHMLDGVTVVVSPLIALMKDQVDALHARGIQASCLHSGLASRESYQRLDALRAGDLKLMYVAPERFRDPRFVSALDQAPPAMIAVDEAHCVSQWGHDFRPDYLRIGNMVRRYPGDRILGLTATATAPVQEDIARHLGLGQDGRAEPAIFVHGFARPNLYIQVNRVATHQEKFSRIRSCIDRWSCGIVYCSTRKQVEKVAAHLKSQGLDVPSYHGGMSDALRTRMQDRFMNREVDVVVATNAFGMGVDRADVRFVVHWDVPGSMEAYYQEIGRAGRDGQDAHVELLYNFADVRTQEFFLEGSNPSRESVLELYELIVRTCASYPIARNADEWADQLHSTNNGMAVQTAMALLERAGLIERQPEPGTRTLAVFPSPSPNLSMLEEQLERLAAKAAHDRARLDALLSYVQSTQCRHRRILEYFGEPMEADHCEACDTCSRGSVGRALEEDEWLIVQKVLSAVGRLNGRYGRIRITEVLKGSNSKAVSTVTDGHDQNVDRRPSRRLLPVHRRHRIPLARSVRTWPASRPSENCSHTRPPGALARLLPGFWQQDHSVRRGRRRADGRTAYLALAYSPERKTTSLSRLFR